MKSPETAFLRPLFARLNEDGVKYAVLRPNASLPDALDGSDLDLLVETKADADRVASVAQRAAAAQQGVRTVRYAAGALVVCFAGKGPDGWWGCHLDIFVGLTYRGVPYVPLADVFAERKLVKNAYYGLGELSEFASFLKEILHNGKSRKDYYPKARALYAVRQDAIAESLRKCYGDAGVGIIASLMQSDCDASALRKAASALRGCLTGGTLSGRMANAFARLGRLWNPPGYSVAFLGTDGSGKSTVIEAVRPVIERMLHDEIHYEHLRPNWLPSLARLAGRPKMEGPVTNPHGGKTAGRLSSLVRFFYYYLDYTLGYARKIYPMLVKRPSMVFFDRYYYEYIIDPKRCAVRLPSGFATFFSHFIPRPKLILCLVGDPKKIFARKPETSFEEVSRQVSELRTLCSTDARAVLVDTTQSLDKTIDQALTAIVESMARRCE